MKCGVTAQKNTTTIFVCPISYNFRHITGTFKGIKLMHVLIKGKLGIAKSCNKSIANIGVFVVAYYYNVQKRTLKLL